MKKKVNKYCFKFECETVPARRAEAEIPRPSDRDRDTSAHRPRQRYLGPQTETEISRPSGQDRPVSKQLSRLDQNPCMRADTLLGI